MNLVKKVCDFGMLCGGSVNNMRATQKQYGYAIRQIVRAWRMSGYASKEKS